MRLADWFVEDILSLSDDEVMAEVREDEMLSEWMNMVEGVAFKNALWRKRHAI